MVIKIKQCLLLLLVVGCCQLGAMDFSTKLFIDQELLRNWGDFREQQMRLDGDTKMVARLNINAKDENKCQILSNCHRKRLEAVNNDRIAFTSFYKEKIDKILDEQKKLVAVMTVIDRENDREIQHGKKRKLEEAGVDSHGNLPDKRRRKLTDRYVEFVLSPFLQ